MSVNFEKYKDSILAAWKDVVDDKNKIDWALFSYEGQTNDLKVVGKGEGGIDEMREDLNSGKIMYAFCKVLDPKTSLYKFVLVNWQGEGAPHHRKATSANHITDVSRLLKGFHVTVNARNEEEVDTDIIVDKLSKATGSVYSFKDRGEVVKECGPVGTAYKRVIPQQEINSNERDKFWQKEEEDEKKRQETEKKRKDEERGRLENEFKQREIEETFQREAKIKERSKSISVLREAERNEMLRIDAGKVGVGGDDITDREEEEVERKTRGETLRRQRSQEAQALIAKRTIDARAVFEQNTSVGQLQQRRASYQPSTNTSVMSPVKEKVSPVAEKAKWPPTVQPVALPPTPPSPPPEEQQRLPEVEETLEPMNNGHQETSASINGNGREEITVHGNGDIERAQPYIEEDLCTNNGEVTEDYEGLDLRAQALYDYQAADNTEISFDPGDIITRIDQIDAGWWQGLAPDGTYGLFPANYVQLLD